MLQGSIPLNIFVLYQTRRAKNLQKMLHENFSSTRVSYILRIKTLNDKALIKFK